MEAQNLFKVCYLSCIWILTTGIPLEDKTQSEQSQSSPQHAGTIRHLLNSPFRVRQNTDNILEHLKNYEITVPVLTDSHGGFVSYDVEHTSLERHKRSANSPYYIHSYSENWIYYKLTAYGQEFHFNLSLNHNLISKKYEVEYWKGNEFIDRTHSHLRDCHYFGHIQTKRTSSVALSNCFGLHGVFATDNEEYFVEPLWNDTINDIDSAGHLHVVYKRSALKPKHTDSHCGVSDVDKQHHDDNWWINGPRFQTEFNQKSKTHKKFRHHDKHRKNKHKDETTSEEHEDDYFANHVSNDDNRWRGKRSVSDERHVETLVVVDKTMVDYHGQDEVEPYILTILNIVAKLYHDATIGNAINILVTRLVVLTEDQPTLLINHHADKSLNSFCKWQKSINPPPADSPEDNNGIAHHDNAILITRFDICTYKNEPCGTLGLAPVAGMCEPDRSCSINEDIGLASAFTIAHEIGHNFGMQHDGAGNPCGTPGNDPAKIMAAQLTKNTDPFSWSTCSRTYITGFLDSGRGKCLRNEPPTVDIKFPDYLPGQRHTANEQCMLQYGEKSRQCKFGDICKELWCMSKNDRCITNNIPAAEGTVCNQRRGKKGWCYRGKCVKYGYKPARVDGQWGPWSSWSDCSRTCGGGVILSERFCDSPKPKHGGKFCIGERRRYKSCNIQHCPLNSTSFREVQCQRLNEIPFRGKTYKWKPYTGGQVKECALNCMAETFNFYTERAPKVIDGTRCSSDSYDMCVNGECRHVGCDRILGSNAIEDKCRVCAGNQTSCKTVEGLFEDNDHVKGGYVEACRISRGAVHISVSEKVTSSNYLALRSADGTYYINGAWTIDWPRKFEVAGTVFHYERPKGSPEILKALGPISEDLVVMVLLQEDNKGIYYEYNVPKDSGFINGTTFVWEYSPWSTCTKSCAKGISEAVPICKRQSDNNTVDNKYCIAGLKPSVKIIHCNEKPCPPDWSIGKWGTCSKTCGGGVKIREIDCVQVLPDNELVQLEKAKCARKKTPRWRMRCNRDKCPPTWATDEWSECKPKCGAGLRTRNVFCVSDDGKDFLNEDKCDAQKRPPNKMKCNMGQCPPPEWVVGAWKKCSSKCGPGTKDRDVMCQTYTGEKSEDCDEREKPHKTEDCISPCEQKPKVCRDRNKVGYCPLVLKFQFCSRPYFRQMCCKTCRDQGF
ncbi:unnamed protein product [Owenia fusiformis]|uniref:A disintegrin and metalloproteinase with thrombospondin motifs 6 n=1 Tax=Owenia fusiformis TaxID=6347 RepID=A0A8S4N0F7_OWEFU|nr:unnamed protein product [Owenia fusiformis]